MSLGIRRMRVFGTLLILITRKFGGFTLFTLLWPQGGAGDAYQHR